MVQGTWTVYLMTVVEGYFMIQNLVGLLTMFSYETFVPTTHLSGLPILGREIGENNEEMSRQTTGCG